MPLLIPELVLFDLDGTLVDSAPDLIYSINKTLAHFSMPVQDSQQIRHWIGDGVEKLLHHSLTNGGNNTFEPAFFDEVLAFFMAVYTKNNCKLSRCYPGVREGLAYLIEKGIKIGCVSNKRERFIGPILKGLDIIDTMSVVIGGDTLSAKKPDPLPLLHAVQVCGKTPASSLMIGDSENDVKAARAAELRIVCVNYGYNRGNDIRYTHPDAVIDSLCELKGLF